MQAAIKDDINSIKIKWRRLLYIKFVENNPSAMKSYLPKRVHTYQLHKVKITDVCFVGANQIVIGDC